MSDTIQVHLVGIPLRIQEEASEHFDELTREFGDLAAADTAAHPQVPARLLELVSALQNRFSSFTEAQEADLAAAIARRDVTMDLLYVVPPDVGVASAGLGAMLDEADEFCAAGEYLLTLKTPPGPLAYRRWYLGQFIDQAAGQPPVSWADWAAAHAPELVGSSRPE